MNNESNKRHENSVNRRDFLKAGSIAGLGLAVGGIASGGCTQNQIKLTAPAPVDHFAAPPLDTVKVGFVGIGNQGSGHFRNLLRIEGVEMKAVCDIRQERIDWADVGCSWPRSRTPNQSHQTFLAPGSAAGGFPARQSLQACTSGPRSRPTNCVSTSRADWRIARSSSARHTNSDAPTWSGS